MKISVEVFSLVPLLFLSLLIQKICCQTDTVTAALVLKVGETIVSAGGSFELGFFSPNNSTNRYVGIWYKNIEDHTVVWVANREVPLTSTVGFLEVIKPGLLVLRNETNITIWSSPTSSLAAVQNPVAQLLDDGNFVVKDGNDDDNNPENFLWQSFDYPTDTFLPGMKLGWNYVTGHEVYVTSSKSLEDPAPGGYTYRLDPIGYPQKMIKMGNNLSYRTGPWNGVGFNGVPGAIGNTLLSFEVVLNSKEAHYSYKLLSSTLSRFTLGPNGIGQRFTWDNQSMSWQLYLSVPGEKCDSYGSCGAYGSCSFGNSAICECLEKFEPKHAENWARRHWSDGCIRKKPLPLGCGSSGDGFKKYSNLKLPNAHNSTFKTNMSLDECEAECKKNCSCIAYSSLDIRNADGGCLFWVGDLIDMKESPEAGGDIYIKLAASELGSDGKKRKILVMVLPSSALILVLVGLGLLLYTHRRKKKHPKSMKQQAMPRYHGKNYMNERHSKEIELPLFQMSRLVKATNNFSSHNKLGEGGYGPVYRGRLEEGHEVAVKRLSERSEQGLDEFKNEAICIARLQHRNLVKLVGCCIEGTEKILIYEYMPNRSLDYFIFDGSRSTLLDWPKRFHIIQGIARGLLYLHQDSRLRVIHRDLKASNILLDADLNPKISDFGTARSFGGNETGDNTGRVVGTQGYISPEYAGDGLFSIKSDVFSFGVLLLEIVSGKRNKVFLHNGHFYNLLGHAWMLNREGRALELVDSNLANSYCPSEVLRAILVGLLCVQQSPEARPEMSSVVFMLGNEGGPLAEAAQPGFFVERCVAANAEITITTIEAR